MLQGMLRMFKRKTCYGGPKAGHACMEVTSAGRHRPVLSQALQLPCRDRWGMSAPRRCQCLDSQPLLGWTALAPNGKAHMSYYYCCYWFYKLFLCCSLPRGMVRLQTSCRLRLPHSLALDGLSRSKQDPVNRLHGAQNLHRPPPAGAKMHKIN